MRDVWELITIQCVHGGMGDLFDACNRYFFFIRHYKMLKNVKLVHICVSRRHIATTQMVLTDVCVALAGF